MNYTHRTKNSEAMEREFSILMIRNRSRKIRMQFILSIFTRRIYLFPLYLSFIFFFVFLKHKQHENLTFATRVLFSLFVYFYFHFG